MTLLDRFRGQPEWQHEDPLVRTSAVDELEDDGRIAFNYCTQDGEVNEGANPNGSARNIAGILNQDRNVLGMMPHPERLAEEALGGTDGKAIFEGLSEALAG